MEHPAQQGMWAKEVGIVIVVIVERNADQV
jgi:hypothetical protein